MTIVDELLRLRAENKAMYVGATEAMEILDALRAERARAHRAETHLTATLVSVDVIEKLLAEERARAERAEAEATFNGRYMREYELGIVDAKAKCDALRADLARVERERDEERHLATVRGEMLTKAERERDEAHNAIGEAQSEIVRLSAPPCDHHEIATLRAAAERVVEMCSNHWVAATTPVCLGNQIDALRSALAGEEVRDGDV